MSQPTEKFDDKTSLSSEEEFGSESGSMIRVVHWQDMEAEEDAVS